MLIEVVHLNGIYSPDKGYHSTPNKLSGDYYLTLVTKLARAVNRGATLLYRPNLTSFTHDIFSNPKDVEKALATDPFLAEAGKLDDLHIRPDGRKPLDQFKEDIALEDALLKTCGRAIILGAYLDACVPDVAWNLSSRNEGFDIGIDMSLSIDRGVAKIRPEFDAIPHRSIEG